MAAEATSLNDALVKIAIAMIGQSAKLMREEAFVSTTTTSVVDPQRAAPTTDNINNDDSGGFNSFLDNPQTLVEGDQRTLDQLSDDEIITKFENKELILSDTFRSFIDQAILKTFTDFNVPLRERGPNMEAFIINMASYSLGPSAFAAITLALNNIQVMQDADYPARNADGTRGIQWAVDAAATYRDYAIAVLQDLGLTSSGIAP